MTNEIDFLPEWYKSSRRKQMSFHRQYVALGVLSVMVLVLHFVVTRSVAQATAAVAAEAPKALAAEKKLARLAEIRSELKELQKQTKVIDEIDSKIRVGSVLAEMSHLIDERIVLSSVEFVAERFEGGQQSNNERGRPAVAVGIAEAKVAANGPPLLGDVRFKVIIRGAAAAASDVAGLICKLEDSPYFCQVVPSFSRDKEINAGPGVVARAADLRNSSPRRAGGLEVSEFEIDCFLANYSIAEESSVE